MFLHAQVNVHEALVQCHAMSHDEALEVDLSDMNSAHACTQLSKTGLDVKHSSMAEDPLSSKKARLCKHYPLCSIWVGPQILAEPARELGVADTFKCNLESFTLGTYWADGLSPAPMVMQSIKGCKQVKESYAVMGGKNTSVTLLSQHRPEQIYSGWKDMWSKAPPRAGWYVDLFLWSDKDCNIEDLVRASACVI